MKRPLLLLIISLVLFSFSEKAIAQTATCQNITVVLDGAGEYSFTTPLIPQTEAEILTSNSSATNTMRWQSFTPTVDGILTDIGVTFTFLSGGNVLTFNVYSGQGNGGSLLYSEPLGTPLTGSTTTVTVDATINLVSGTEYSFEVIDATGSFALRAQDGDPYGGGISSINADTDLTFSLDLLQRPEIDNSSTAPLGIESFGLSQLSFDCSNVGTNPVTLTVTENGGATSTCVSTVTVEDNQIPVAACQNITVALNGAGSATIAAADLDGGSTDNCTLSFSVTQTTFTCAHVGANPVTLTVTDSGGNTDDCSATVTITELTPPTATCQDVTLVLNNSGSADLLPGAVDNGSTDNCGVSNLFLSQNSYNCANLGTNTVTLTVEDNNGNTSICTSTITVEDNEIPVIICPSDIIVCSDDNSGIVVNYLAPDGTDNCSSVTVQSNSGPLNGTLFPVGITNQEWTVTDIPANNSASCSFTVTVNATPVSDFSFTSACQGESVFFTDLSTIHDSSSITSWTWNMGDGSGPIGTVDPIHAFADTGMFNVSLLVVSAENCSNLSQQMVHVTAVPTAGFTFVNACEGDTTVFTNTSTIDADTMNYVWDFGDTNTSSDESPKHIYTSNGTYTVTLTVTSDNGCEDEFTASVEVYDSPTALFSATTECEGMATEFTNLSTGGGTLSYEWDFGNDSTSTNPSPTNLYASGGTYTVSLTTTNSSGCSHSSTVSVIVNDLPNVDFTFDSVCEGSQANFINFSNPGTYAWNLGDASSSTLANVSHVYSTFGMYDVTLTVTDANFCINSDTQQIEIFDLPDFVLTPTDVSCYGEATGSIDVTPIGTPNLPWTLVINGAAPQPASNLTGLVADTYVITAADSANGCEFTVSTVVMQPSDTLGINLNTISDILCHGDNSGSIYVTGSGGTAPYTYTIDSGTGLFNGLEDGTYNVQITDNNLCVFDTTITLVEPDTLVLGFVASTDLLCNGDNSGWISVLATGGVMPYEYKLDGGAYDMAADFSGLAAGTYTVGVLDANGCSDTLHVTLTEPGILHASVITASDSTACFGEFNGFIETAAASGTAPYQFSIDGINFQGDSVFQGLSSGTYIITVMDANGCLDDTPETFIDQPTELTIETSSTPVACFGEQTATIQITADGGTLNYLYSIDGGSSLAANGGSFTGLPSGSYLAVVEDVHGCIASEGIVISQPSDSLVLTASVTDAACIDSASGSVELLGVGGTPTYMYSDDEITYMALNEFGGYATGTYTFYGMDLNGCIDSIEVNIGEPATLVSITGTLSSNPACPNEASGTISVQAAGGTPGYSYSSNGGATFQANPILANLNGVNHLVVVMDANGCLADTVVELVSPEIIVLTIDEIVNVDCENDTDGEIHVTATGGTPSYNYTLNGGNIQTNGDFVGLTNGEYTLMITDVNGCPQTSSQTVMATQMQPQANFSFYLIGESVFFVNASSFGDSYFWEFGDDSTSTEVSPTHLYTQPGVYEATLTVSNACGSTSFTSTIVTGNIGVNDAKQLAFNLYPNPATDEVFIEPNYIIEGDITMEIVSTTGQLIRSLRTNLPTNNRLQIDLNGLTQGIYHLRLVSEKEQSVVRFDIIK